MQSAFESWVGQHVLVRLILGKIKVSLRGILLKDRTETLLMGGDFGYRRGGCRSPPCLARAFWKVSSLELARRMDQPVQMLTVSLGFKNRRAPLRQTFPQIFTTTDFHIDRRARKTLA